MQQVKSVRALTLDFSNFKNHTPYGKIYRTHIITGYSLDEVVRFCSAACTYPSYRHRFKRDGITNRAEVICDFAVEADAKAFAKKFKINATAPLSVFDFGELYGQELKNAMGIISDTELAEVLFSVSVRQSIIDKADAELLFTEYETILYNIFSFKFQEYYNTILQEK